MRLRLMSFNIQHGQDHVKKLAGEKVIDLDRVADGIRTEGADIAALNEVRGWGVGRGYTAQMEMLSETLGMTGIFAQAITVPFGGAYGNGVLSRFPVVSNETIPIPPPSCLPPRYEKRCICRCVIKTGGVPLTVFATHLGLSDEERKSGVSVLTALAAKENNPFVMMGDFNMTPENPLMQPLFSRMQDVLGKQGATFPSEQPKQRIDYIFISEQITLLSAAVGKAVISDHRYITADISV